MIANGVSIYRICILYIRESPWIKQMIERRRSHSAPSTMWSYCFQHRVSALHNPCGTILCYAPEGCSCVQTIVLWTGSSRFTESLMTTFASSPVSIDVNLDTGWGRSIPTVAALQLWHDNASRGMHYWATGKTFLRVPSKLSPGPQSKFRYLWRSVDWSFPIAIAHTLTTQLRFSF